MNLGKITLITPPDKLFNMNLSYLLIKPSTTIKEKFQTILSQSIDDINVFIYDDDDIDISWALSIAHQVEVVIIDIDNCDYITKHFISFLLAMPNTYYITVDETVPYKLISKNRIFDLDWIIDRLQSQDEDEEEDNDVSEE
jgi:hypothetical protein